MGDDVDTHEEFWDYGTNATVDDLLVDLASGYLPSVAGDVGWAVRLENASGRSPGILGLIYVPNIGGSATICRPSRTSSALSSLATAIGVDVYSAYLPGARPQKSADVHHSRTRDGRRLHRRATRDGAPDSPTWRQISELRALDSAGSERRRDWMRHNVVSGMRLPGADVFVANAFHLLFDSLCPASMALTAEVFDIPGSGSTTQLTGWQVTEHFGDTLVATTAMVLCAFEWRLTNLSWEHGVDSLGSAYLRQLAYWGHPLTAPEEVMAGIRDVRDVVGGA